MLRSRPARNTPASTVCRAHRERLCTAVGYFARASNAPSYPLAVRWNGSRWLLSRTRLHIPPHGSILSGVSCTSRIACTAVGYTSDAIGNALALVERWNGSQWSSQSAASPFPGGRGYQLIGVSCTSTRSCTAVGDLRNGLAEHWNGVKWSVKSPTSNFMVDYGYGALNAISCISPTACAAVGSAVFEGVGDSALEEAWNGAAWSFNKTRAGSRPYPACRAPRRRPASPSATLSSAGTARHGRSR